MEVRCTHCGISHELRGKQYLCPDCKRVHQNGLHKRNREAWYDIVGSECEVCGYCNSTAALDFHHNDPSEKLFGIGSKFNAHHPDTCKPEIRKAILLEVGKCKLMCSNCHRELHDNE